MKERGIAMYAFTSNDRELERTVFDKLVGAKTQKRNELGKARGRCYSVAMSSGPTNARASESRNTRDRGCK